jgi:hypothetical protein
LEGRPGVVILPLFRGGSHVTLQEQYLSNTGAAGMGSREGNSWRPFRLKRAGRMIEK